MSTYPVEFSRLEKENKQLQADLENMAKQIGEQNKEIEQLKESCKAHAEYAQQRLDKLQQAEGEIKRLEKKLKK